MHSTGICVIINDNANVILCNYVLQYIIAFNGNRTRVDSLEGSHSTTEL